MTQHKLWDLSQGSLKGMLTALRLCCCSAVILPLNVLSIVVPYLADAARARYAAGATLPVVGVRACVRAGRPFAPIPSSCSRPTLDHVPATSARVLARTDGAAFRDWQLMRLWMNRRP